MLGMRTERREALRVGEKNARRAGRRLFEAGLFAAEIAAPLVILAAASGGALADDAAGVYGAPVNSGPAWKVYKTEWTPADEARYAAFVQAIGRSACTSLEGCLQSDANPYRGPDDDFSGDCADMAYTLRAYFAWKHGLPFSYQNAMRTADGKPEDVRYSTAGNRVAGRRDAVGQAPVSAPGFIRRIAGEVSTAMFRTHPEVGGKGALFDDFYPIAINREAVRPGVIAYDIYGHVGIVYDVLDDGRVLVVASHPDHSVTRTTYGANFLRAKPDLGAGLKAWRPIRLEGAAKRADGSYAGGRVRAAGNDEIADYSLEQYFGNVARASGEWHEGEFQHEGRTVNYYEYVRRRLAAPGFAYDPVDELRNSMRAICGAVKDRKTAVDRATSMRIYLKDHPGRLPPNIFGTYGQWEEFSTPSRDARLKVSFIDLRRTTQEHVEQVARGDAGVLYGGDDLAGDLWAAFTEEKDACTVTYWRSDNTRVRLNLGHVMDRLWDLSFDPYHCPERRWGATGTELETCVETPDKTRWYNAQRHLRYQAERTYDVRMDFTVDELKPPSVAGPADGGLGVEAPADADLRAYLSRLLPTPVAALETTPPVILIGDRSGN